MRSRRVTIVATAILIGFVVLAGAAGAQSDDIADQCRTIIGCADAGPAPENPGDRGGYAQLLTFVALFGAIGFIAWRIIKQAKPNTVDAA